MHDFTVTLNSQGIVVDYDDMSNILGYDKNEVIGQNWFEIFISDGDIKSVLDVFFQLFSSCDIQKISPNSNDVRVKKGKHIFIDFTNEMFFDKNNELLVRSNGKEHYK